MIASWFYFVCFILLFFNPEKCIRAMACFGIAHTILENAVYFWFYYHPEYFDITLFMTSCWILDICLLFSSACVLKGLRKKLTLSVGVPVLFLQMVTMQFPFLIPGVLNFVLNSSYQTFMETTILCSSFKESPASEWIKSSIIISLLVIARFIPELLH